MRPPQIPLTRTAQAVVEIERAEQLLQIEEDQADVCSRLHRKIGEIKSAEGVRWFQGKCSKEYVDGNMSERTKKRVVQWVKKRLAELEN